MKKYIIPAIVIVAVVVLGIVSFFVFSTPRSPGLTVSDQSLDGNQITIDSFYLDKPGYIVIHQSVDGALGPVIGNSELVSGSHKNFQVTIDETLAGAMVFAMLHYDDGDSGYEFPGPDGAVILEGGVVMKPINLN